MAYLLDTNVFISAKRVHYGFDFCPGFWDWVSAQHHAGKLFSIEHVFQEIKDQQDDLAAWARALPRAFFLAPDASTVASYTKVNNWAASHRYKAPAISDFLQTADFHLVSQALQGAHTVVTYEVPGGSANKIKIPDACLGLGVACVRPHELLRQEQARFVLGGSYERAP